MTQYCWLIELFGEPEPWYYEGPGEDAEAVFTDDPRNAMKFDRQSEATLIAQSLATWLGDKQAVEHRFE